MTAVLLLEELDRLRVADEATPVLREFLLDLAIRGRLVEQRSDDEPARELLVRIAAHRLEGHGRAKASSRRASRPAVGVPALFELPDTWAWTCVEEIGYLNPKNDAPSGRSVSFVAMSQIPSDYGAPHGHEVRPWGEIKKGYTHFAEGDVGVAKITPCFENGKSTIFHSLAGGIGSGTTELYIVRPVFVDPAYLLIFLKSPTFIRGGVPKMTGTAGQKRLPVDYFAHAPLPLPPLAEQRRIVAKLGQLMALRDQLERAEIERSARRDAMRGAWSHHVVSSRYSTHVPRDTIRLFLEQIPRLVEKPKHVAAIRQSIIDLAVRGHLLRQDPGDEPAAAMLERISSARAKLLAREFPNAAEAKTQRKKQSQQALPSTLPELPAGWQWSTLMQCSALVVDCRNKTVPYTASGITLLRTTNVRDGHIVLSDHRYVSDETYQIWSSRYRPEPGDIVITREAPMGEVAKIPDGLVACLGQRIMLARLVEGTIHSDFLVYSLRDSALMDRVQDKPIGSMVEHLRVGGVETLLVPVPPQREQQRIVAKLDQLMDLCDQLRSELTTARSISGRLLTAALLDALDDDGRSTASSRVRSAAV